MNDCDDPIRASNLENFNTTMTTKKSLQEEIEATKERLRVVKARQYRTRAVEEEQAELIQQLERLEERLKAMQWDKTGELI